MNKVCFLKTAHSSIKNNAVQEKCLNAVSSPNFSAILRSEIFIE